jgi:hypothetical protein
MLSSVPQAIWHSHVALSATHMEPVTWGFWRIRLSSNINYSLPLPKALAYHSLHGSVHYER